MKLLIILSRFPYPLEKGDKLRAYYQLKYLSKKHEIYCITLNDRKLSSEEINIVSSFCKELHVIDINWFAKLFNICISIFSNFPFQCAYFFSYRSNKKIKKLIKNIDPDHIYCQLVRVAEYVKKIDIKKTIDYQDVLSKGMYRIYEKSPFYKKIFYYIEYKRLAKYENDIFKYFDNHTIITDVDRDLISHHKSDQIVVVANGVDLDKYKYNGEDKIYDLIFSGNMNYTPNVDAAEFLALSIIPELKRTFPYIKLVICGANPSLRVKMLANENIEITGWVDSITEYYCKSKIFIAPMRLGTGLQNKLLEAMAVGLPCITSQLAGNPLYRVKKDEDILIYNTVSGYVDAVSMLLTSPSLYDKISKNGHQYVIENYNWEHVAAILDELISK